MVQKVHQFSQMNDFRENVKTKCFQSLSSQGFFSSWFCTTWLNHQTVFHVVPSSRWAESLHRHEIFTVCLSASPSCRGYSIPGPLAGFQLDGDERDEDTTHKELHSRWRERTHLHPPVPFWPKVTVFDALETRFKCSCAGEYACLFKCVGIGW